MALTELAAANTARDLSEDSFLQSLGRRTFVDKLSYYYDGFNHIHPFREGNGRTQREFWNRVAEDAGWFIDWSRVHGKQIDEASRIAREHQDYEPLNTMFTNCVEPLAS